MRRTGFALILALLLNGFLAAGHGPVRMAQASDAGKRYIEICTSGGLIRIPMDRAMAAALEGAGTGNGPAENAPGGDPIPTEPGQPCVICQLGHGAAVGARAPVISPPQDDRVAPVCLSRAHQTERSSTHCARPASRAPPGTAA